MNSGLGSLSPASEHQHTSRAQLRAASHTSTVQHKQRTEHRAQSSKPHNLSTQANNPLQAFAVVVGVFSAVTALIYCIPLVIRKFSILFAWDVLIFFFWIVLFGIFGKVSFSPTLHPTPLPPGPPELFGFCPTLSSVSAQQLAGATTRIDYGLEVRKPNKALRHEHKLTTPAFHQGRPRGQQRHPAHEERGVDRPHQHAPLARVGSLHGPHLVEGTSLYLHWPCCRLDGSTRTRYSPDVPALPRRPIYGRQGGVEGGGGKICDTI